MVGRTRVGPLKDTAGLYQQAVEIVRSSGKASPSMIAHRLKVGFDLAEELLRHMEANGLVTPCDVVGARRIANQVRYSARQMGKLCFAKRRPNCPLG